MIIILLVKICLFCVEIFLMH